MAVFSELIHAAGILAAAGCLPATDGNLSARIAPDRVLITASGIEKRAMDESSFVELNLNERAPAGASTEWQVHRSLYLARPEVQCVLHVHAPNLNAFAAAHRTPDVNLLSEAQMAVGEIVLVPYVTPGTSELAETVARSSRTAAVYLMANHGVVAVGATVREALHRLERAEFLASVELKACLLGGAKPVPSS